MAQTVKNLPAMWENRVWSLGQEDSLEKGMATHSSILGWRILWTEEPDGLQSMRSQRVGNNSATNTFSRGTVDQIFIDHPRSTCSWQLSHFQEASSISYWTTLNVEVFLVSAGDLLFTISMSWSCSCSPWEHSSVVLNCGSKICNTSWECVLTGEFGVGSHSLF